MLNKPTTALDDGSYGTALMVACYRDKADIVSRLLQIPGLDTDYQDPDYGLSAVHVAVLPENLSPNCLRLLAETAGVDVNRKDRMGETPLVLLQERRL